MNAMDISVTGVHNGTDVEHWDNGYIDLGYEDHIEYCYDYQKEGYCDCDLESGTLLLGDWLKDNEDCYYPDPDGEYSAIYNPNENTIQVTRSKHMIRCNHCSPCYPGQGDVDSVGDTIAFMLPPDMMREDWVTENKERFVNLEEST